MNDFSIKPVYRFVALILAVLCASLTGCQQPAANPQGGERAALFNFNRSPLFGGNSRYANSQQTNANRYASQVPDIQITDPQQYQQYANNAANQVQDLNQRLGSYDSDNQLLNTEIAGLQQKLQLANQYNQTLKEQLAGTSSQIQQTFAERQAAAQQVADLQMQLEQANQNLRITQQQNQTATGQLTSFNRGSPTQLAGGATIRANNVLSRRLSTIQIPGGEARMDGDVIRIEFPSDRMFVPGTYQIQSAQIPLLRNITGTIRESFPRNIVGIEAHWDNTPLNPAGTTHHQLTATQALAVFDNLVRLGLPNNQLFTMAMASNRPRHRQGVTGGVSPNRRIEIVIYPETFDGSQP